MDLGLTVVASVVDAELASEVAEICMVSHIRSPTESQRMSVQWRFGVHDDRIAGALQLMQDSIEQPIPLSEVARVVGLSLRQMQRLFLRYFGKGPHEIYLAIRLRRAHEMLIGSNSSILTIALKCGFSDNAHFTRQFKALFGRTPASARTAMLRTRSL